MRGVFLRLNSGLNAHGRNSEHYVKHSEEFELLFALHDLQPLLHNTKPAQTEKKEQLIKQKKSGTVEDASTSKRKRNRFRNHLLTLKGISYKQPKTGTANPQVELRVQEEPPHLSPSADPSKLLYIDCDE